MGGGEDSDAIINKRHQTERLPVFTPFPPLQVLTSYMEAPFAVLHCLAGHSVLGEIVGVVSGSLLALLK